MKQKLIELWKNDCEDCEAAKPIVAQLQENRRSDRPEVVEREMLAFQDRSPTKEELIRLAKGGEYYESRNTR